MNSNLIKGFRTLAMSLALIGLMLAGPMSETANATARGCTAAPSGSVCILVTGKGLHVNTIHVERTKLSWNMICHYSAKAVIRYPNGKSETLQVKSQKNCAVGKAWFDWDVNKDYPHGSRVYVYFYEDGKQQGGAPAITVHR